MKSKACAFTGHRALPPGMRGEISAKLHSIISKLKGEGYTEFLCGGALGFDMLAAIEVLRIKKEEGGVKLHLALPCRNWNNKWSISDRRLYDKILQNADSVLYLSEGYTPGCMQKRNRYLIDNASKCIAYYNGSRGGTAYTVYYAIKNRVDIVNLLNEI